MQGTLAEYIPGMNLRAQIQMCWCVRHLLGPIQILWPHLLLISPPLILFWLQQVEPKWASPPAHASAFLPSASGVVSWYYGVRGLLEPLSTRTVTTQQCRCREWLSSGANPWPVGLTPAEYMFLPFPLREPPADSHVTFKLFCRIKQPNAFGSGWWEKGPH